MRTITHQEFLKEAESRFGKDPNNWKFVCPACGTVQSIRQLRDAVVASGGAEKDVNGYIAFSCIGRFTGQGDKGISAKNRGEKWDAGCNWTLEKLLRIHQLEMIMQNKNTKPTFELATK